LLPVSDLWNRDESFSGGIDLWLENQMNGQLNVGAAVIITEDLSPPLSRAINA
jgi:hypothetical protein